MYLLQPVLCSRTPLGNSPSATRPNAPPPMRENRITSLRPQVPELNVDVSHTVATVPLLTSIFLILPFTKNAICRLSGDQNGPSAPSVPGRGVTDN